MAITKEDGISVGLLVIIGGVVLPGFVAGYLLLSNYLQESREEAKVEKTYNANRAQYKSVKGDAEAKLKTQQINTPDLDKTGKKDPDAAPGKKTAKINIENAMDLVVANQAEKLKLAAETQNTIATEDAPAVDDNANEKLSTGDEATEEKPAKGIPVDSEKEKPADDQDKSTKKKQG